MTIDKNNKPLKRLLGWVGPVVSLICVFLLLLTKNFPLNFDLLLGLPISKATFSPDLYSRNDLIISSGLSGPFHLYKLLGWLYYWKLNVELIVFVFLLCLLFFTFWICWLLAFEIAEDPSVASLVTFLIALSDPLRGSLNWSSMPLLIFVTASFSMPFALFAVLLAFKKKYLCAMIFAGVTFNLHPYVGLITGMVCAVLLVFESEITLVKKRFYLGLAAIVALPNASYILINLPANFSINPSANAFYSQFSIYAYHAFIEDHWREGYGWFFLNLAGLLFWFQFLNKNIVKIVKRTILTLISLVLIYVINLYAIHNTTIEISFLFRATYILKPILFSVIFAGVSRWLISLKDYDIQNFSITRRLLADYPSDSKNIKISSATSGKNKKVAILLGQLLHNLYPIEGYICGAILIFSTLIPAVPLSEAFLLFFYGLVLSITINPQMKIYPVVKILLILSLFEFPLAFIVWLQTYLRPGLIIWPDFLTSQNFQNWIVGFNVLMAFILALIFIFKTLDSPFEEKNPKFIRLIPPKLIYVLLVCLSVILSMPGIVGKGPEILNFIYNNNVYFSRPQPDVVGVFNWAQTKSSLGSLFVVPPDDDHFAPFRLSAERGVLITLSDINQLAFNTKVYIEGQERLDAVGMKVLGRHEFDSTGYYSLNIDQLQNLNKKYEVDYVVFENRKIKDWSIIRNVVYKDENFTIISIQSSSIAINR